MALRETLGRAPYAAVFTLLTLFGTWSCESRAPAPPPLNAPRPPAGRAVAPCSSPA